MKLGGAETSIILDVGILPTSVYMKALRMQCDGVSMERDKINNEETTS